MTELQNSLLDASRRMVEDNTQHTYCDFGVRREEWLTDEFRKELEKIGARMEEERLWVKFIAD